MDKIIEPTPELVELAQAVDECVASPVGDRSHEELGVDLAVARTLINRLELFFARRAARFAKDFDYEYGENPVGWIREHCHMTVAASATAVTVGEYEHRVPASIQSFLDGRIGIAHLGQLADTAEFAALCPVPVEFDETKLLASAERKNVYQFRKDCYHVRHAMHAATCVDMQVDSVDYRRLEMRASIYGMTLNGEFDSEAAALIRTALEPLARPVQDGEHRSREKRLADALVELVAHRLDTGDIPARASQRAHLQVTTTLETLQGLAGAPGGELDESGVIPDATVQRLACDSTVTRVLLNPESAVIDVGRSRRLVPAATRRALNIRDKGCRWPGCDRSASWTQAHHIVFWTRGGRTDLDNLVLLCHRHHWFVHEVGFQILRTDDGQILTVPPQEDRHRQARPPTAAAA